MTIKITAEFTQEQAKQIAKLEQSYEDLNTLIAHELAYAKTHFAVERLRMGKHVDFEQALLSAYEELTLRLLEALRLHQQANHEGRRLVRLMVEAMNASE